MKIKTFLKPVLALSFLVMLSCSSSNDDGSSNEFPKTVSITYKVKSTNTTTAQAISYKNDTGGTTMATNVDLPFSVSITRIVNQNDDASVGFSSTTQNANVTLEILVDGTVVKTQNFTSGTGAMAYIFQ
jgi:hypothetical protein